MGRLRKCKICGELIQADAPCIPFENRYAHESCYKNYVKGMLDSKLSDIKQKSKDNKKSKSKAKPKAELKDALNEEQYKDKQNYYKYLRKLTDDGELSPKVYTVSEGYISRYGVSWDDLYQTLVYMNEILCKELKGDIVGIIPFFIQESRKYREEVERAYNTAKNTKIAELYNLKTIFVKPKKRKINQIDITTV